MTSKHSELVIGKKTKQQLSKPQQSFNRLVKKLEKLRQELEQTSKLLNKHLDFYGKHIHPLEQELVAVRQEGVKLFYKFYKDEKSLSKKDKKGLLDLMAMQLSGIFQNGNEPPDEEIKEIFEVIEGVSYEKATEEDFESMKDDMAKTFNEMGLDIDLDDFNSDLSEEEMMRKMFEMLENLKEQAEAKAAEEPKRKKSKKQIEKEEREKQVEEVKNKNIASIYKQLARAFHPDLEQDPKLKLKKEDLMKELTSAYEKNDLHTLLRLELEWIHKEEANLDKLSNEKLAIYNQVLKEQIEELEAERFLMSQHPRYQPLQQFKMFSIGPKFLDLEKEKHGMKATIEAIKDDIKSLKSKDAVKTLKSIINIYSKPKPKFNIFDMDLEDLFG